MTRMSYPIARLLCSLLGLMFSWSVWADMADISRIYRQTPALNHFEVCHGGGCALVGQASLTLEEWRQVTQLFSAVHDAQQERAAIALSIGKLEQIVGQKIGTSTDKAGTFDNSQYSGQLDCNDESINTTTYMRLLKQSGYIKWHEIEDMRTRDFFFTGWPHTTAVIHEVESSKRYAVDSWFYDNGHAATIVPFEIWKDGYHPEDSPIYKAQTK